MTAPRSGLGRGLAAIFTGPAAPGEQSVRGRLVESALSSLAASGPLRLCGHVHDVDGTPAVALRSPELSSLHPTEAYQLFSNLSSIAQAGTETQRFRMGRLDAYAVVTSHPTTASVFFFGDEDLTEERATHLVNFCTTYAPVIHTHDLAPSADEHVHLALDVQGGEARAEVTLDDAAGVGTAAKASRAAAAGALALLYDDASVVDVGEVRAASGAAACVVVARRGRTIKMAAAPITAGSDAAAAVAALRSGRLLAHAAQA